MEAIIFALLSYFCWGTGDIFITVASRKCDVLTATFWSSIVSLVFLSILSVFFLGSLSLVTPQMFIVCLVIGLLFLVGYLFFVQALIVGNAALVGAIIGSYGVITVILSIVFFHDSLSPFQGIAIGIIFLGIVLSTLHYKDVVQKKIKLGKGTLYALGAMILFGIWAVVIKVPITHIGWFWPNLFMFLVFPPGILWVAKIRKTSIHNPFKSNVMQPLAIGAIMARVGELSYNLAVSKGLIAVVAPISTSYPTLFAVLAFFVFKDRITKQQIAGVVVTLVGIVFLAVSSS